MTTTPHLRLPLLAASQAQKHVTHNDALLTLDALVQLGVRGAIAAPPPSPAAGERWLVAAPASGAFDGRKDSVASYEDGAWRFRAPEAGWLVWLETPGRLLVFDGASWRDPPARVADQFGIQATPDAINRLAVASPSALFTHAGADLRVTINKASAAATGSMLFQTDGSGRAELGLAGDDDFSVKVSGDGAVWRAGAVFDCASGRARFPQGVEHAPTRKPLCGVLFTPGGDGVVSLFRLDGARAATPRTATIAAISGDVVTLTSAVSNQFFGAQMQNVSYARAWNVSKSPPAPVWLRAAPASDRLAVLDAASLAGFLPGEVLQLGDPTPSVTPSRAIAIDISPMMQRIFGVVFPQSGLIAKIAASGVARVGFAISPSALPGSFANVASMNDGALNHGLALIPCVTPSPVSASNLVFVREDDAGPATVTICLATSMALLA